MADASLDDIIKQRNIRPGTTQGNRNDVNGAIGRGRPLAKGRLYQSVCSDLGIEPQVVGDARNRIIEKKRMRFPDARDRLAEIAKQGDARDKINNIRKKTGTVSNRIKKVPTAWKNTGTVVEKIIRNENRPSDLGGKTRMQGAFLLRTVAGRDGISGKNTTARTRPGALIRSMPNNGRTQSFSRAGDSSRYHPLPNNPHVVTIKNDKADLFSSYNPELSRQQEMRPPRIKLTARSPPYRALRLESALSQSYGLSLGGMRSDIMSTARSQMYRPRRSPELEEIRPTRLKITTANNYREPSPQYSSEWSPQARLPARLPSRTLGGRLPAEIPERLAMRVPAKKRPLYDDDEVEPLSRPKKTPPISSGLMARLDQPQRPAAPQGGKVLVTNLHHCVSVEDMEELFGTIGPILSTRMVREGVAEAVFMHVEDAYRSVEVFNNRQLDGQPMCVTVVSKKTTSAAAPPPAPPRSQTKSVLKAARNSLSKQSPLSPHSIKHILQQTLGLRFYGSSGGLERIQSSREPRYNREWKSSGRVALHPAEQRLNEIVTNLLFPK
ncbi:uncharacterized protein [Procambarus clarkii]|uniref:uncharacterized protein isoform X4 n=1 Tax=Procambarus clarkii TaxID=6728 RepID=UPI0037432F67